MAEAAVVAGLDSELSGGGPGNLDDGPLELVDGPINIH